MDIMIYGTGRCGQYVFEEINKSIEKKVYIKGWIDNYTNTKEVHKLPVMTEEKFISEEICVDAIIVAMLDDRTIQDVVLSLLEHGFRSIYVVDNLIFRGRLSILNEEGTLSMYVKGYENVVPVFGRIQYPVVDHCNLNCRGCGSFANIAEPSFVSCEEFQNDILAMRRKNQEYVWFYVLRRGSAASSQFGFFNCNI